MRQLIVKVPQGNKNRIFNIVEDLEGKNTIHIPNGENDLFLRVLTK